MNLHTKQEWRFRPFEDAPAIYTSKPPNRFQRWMWSLLLGVQWTREP